MRRRTPHTLSPNGIGQPPASPSTQFVYGAGHRATRETVQGREYYESGRLSREWVATRERLELDERLLSPAARRRPWRFLHHVKRFVLDFAIWLAAIAFAVTGAWMGWTLGRIEGAIVAMVIVAIIYASGSAEGRRG